MKTELEVDDDMAADVMVRDDYGMCNHMYMSPR